MTFRRKLAAAAAASGGAYVTTVAFAGSALAEAGQPVPWQLGIQRMVTPVGHDGVSFHDHLLLPIITFISVFVLGLLLYCIIRFNAKANPTPSRTTHNTVLEVLWTVVPIVILVVIAVPSFKLLYFSDRAVDAEMTIKATGYQWYWGYEYPDHGNFYFEAVMLEDDEREEGQPRLLATDTQVVVPVDTSIRVLVTAEDVLHSWAVPSLFVKMDAVPGRLNETWFRAEEEGIYYGQCSELCGVRHAFMPIMVKVVSKEAFAEWVKTAQEEYAAKDADTPVKLAARSASSD